MIDRPSTMTPETHVPLRFCIRLSYHILAPFLVPRTPHFSSSEENPSLGLDERIVCKHCSRGSRCVRRHTGNQHINVTSNTHHNKGWQSKEHICNYCISISYLSLNWLSRYSYIFAYPISIVLCGTCGASQLTDFAIRSSINFSSTRWI